MVASTDFFNGQLKYQPVTKWFSKVVSAALLNCVLCFGGKYFQDLSILC